MAECYASEELSQHDFVDVVRPVEDRFGGVIVVFGAELNLVRQVLQGAVLFEGVVLGYVLVFLGKRIAGCLFKLLPVVLAHLVQEKVASYVEYFDRLHVVSLKSCPREKHVRNFPESQGGVRVKKLYACRRDVDVPLGKICMREDEQVNNV